MPNEIWKDIEGYEGFYKISNLGRVKSLPRKWVIKERILTPTPQSKGYLRVRMLKDGIQKDFFVHRLVAKAFVENPDGKPEVNHKNGIKTDNGAKNLEWMTSSENTIHSYETGLIDIELFKKPGKTKLTQEQADEIRRIYVPRKISQASLAKKYGVSVSLINQIILRKRTRL